MLYGQAIKLGFRAHVSTSEMLAQPRRPAMIELIAATPVSATLCPCQVPAPLLARAFSLTAQGNPLNCWLFKEGRKMRIRCHAEYDGQGVVLSRFESAQNAASVRNYFVERGIGAVALQSAGAPNNHRVYIAMISPDEFREKVAGSNIELIDERQSPGGAATQQ